MEDDAHVKPLVSLCHDYDHYLLCIGQFDKGVASWLPDYKRWINKDLGRSVLEKLAVTLPEGECLRVLGVGSGEGEVEYNLLSRIVTKYPKIHNTVVDPSETQLRLYKDMIEGNGSELAGVVYDWRVETLGQYMASGEGDQTKFHLISALFCLYYEPDMDASLAYLYSRLAPGGVLLVGLESERCDVIRIEERFQFAPDDRNPLFSSRDVRNFYDRRGIPYVPHSQLAGQHDFDITACFDDSSHSGALLLDFLSNVLGFCENVPVAVLEEFRGYLRSLATFKDGKIFLYYDAEHIIATKM